MTKAFPSCYLKLGKGSNPILRPQFLDVKKIKKALLKVINNLSHISHHSLLWLSLHLSHPIISLEFSIEFYY